MTPSVVGMATTTPARAGCSDQPEIRKLGSQQRPCQHHRAGTLSRPVRLGGTGLQSDGLVNDNRGSGPTLFGGTG